MQAALRKAKSKSKAGGQDARDAALLRKLVTKRAKSKAKKSGTRELSRDGAALRCAGDQ